MTDGRFPDIETLHDQQVAHPFGEGEWSFSVEWVHDANSRSIEFAWRIGGFPGWGPFLRCVRDQMILGRM